MVLPTNPELPTNPYVCAPIVIAYRIKNIVVLLLLMLFFDMQYKNHYLFTQVRRWVGVVVILIIFANSLIMLFHSF